MPPLWVPFIISMCVGSIGLLHKEWMPSFFFYSIWMTSIPHTLATFTRKDIQGIRAILMAILAYLVFLSAVLHFSESGDRSMLFTLYFFWQHYHYSRQNQGLSFRSSSNPRWPELQVFLYLLLAALPIMISLSDGPQNFFGYAIQNPMPFVLSSSLGLTLQFLALGILLLIARGKARAHALTHGVLFTLAYASSLPFFMGWFFLNLYHNTQYLGWIKGQKKGRSGLLTAFGLTALIYWMTRGSPEPLLLLALNFTHYTWDGIIWRRAFGKTLS